MTLYIAIKGLHVGAVFVTITLFTIRWLLSFQQPYTSLPRWLRILPHINDTVLLASAITLATMAGLSPLGQAWLTAKIVALLVYIGLGTIALKRAKTPASKLIWGLAALSCVGYIVLVALSRSPSIGL